MSKWEDFPRDFLRRTMLNVENYRGTYDVVNLINNCLGMIVIPNEHLIEALPEYSFDHADKRFGIDKNNITYEHKENYKLSNILRHVRNGLSHGLIEQRTQDEEIIGVRFFDRADRDSPDNFSLELSINELRQFAFSLAKAFLDDFPNNTQQ